jgi:hypothetical protein
MIGCIAFWLHRSGIALASLGHCLLAASLGHRVKTRLKLFFMQSSCEPSVLHATCEIEVAHPASL